MAMSGKPGGGVSGKPGGGMGGGGGGRGPMTAEDADAANQTRRQNLYTTVGGLSRPGGANAPLPRARPSGPSGPPVAGAAASAGRGQPPTPRQRPGLDPNLLDPLIKGRDPLTGAPSAVPGRGATPLAHPGQADGMAELQDPMLEYDPATGKMRRKQFGGITDSITRIGV